MKELPDICAALNGLGDDLCAFATVIHVEGSAYRRPGARMLLTPDARSWGMVSGGCLEHDVLDHARRAMQSGESRVVRYDSMSDDDILFGTGLGCNGIIDVFIEPIPKQFSESLINAVKSCQTTRQSGAVATVIGGGANHGLSGQHAFLVQGRWTGNEMVTSLLEARLTESEGPVLLSGETSCGQARVLVQPLLPPIQLVISGGWVDVVPLIRIAREIGFEIVVVDSRQRLSSQRLNRRNNTS
jgi:xanthine/CO dehydrogenase XdhC/CoxF family maturation factor